MAQIRFGPCQFCGQRVMTRGRSVLNIHGTPLNHDLSCTGRPTAPGTQLVAGSQEAKDSQE